MSSVRGALSDDLVTDVCYALKSVLDPCSVFNGSRLSFLELGMIESIERSGPGRVRVRLLLDDPTCLYMAQIQNDIRAAALTVPGVEAVDFEVVGDDLWTEERATERARQRLRRQLPIRPARGSVRPKQVS